MTDLDVGVWRGSGKDPTLLLFGAPEGLSELARILKTPTQQVFRLSRRPTPSGPYTHSLRLIRIRIEPARGMTISRDGDEVLLTGEPGALAMLGENVARFSRGELGSRIHVDYYPGHFYLRDDTLPLLICWLSDI